jgi:hypothetical protein
MQSMTCGINQNMSVLRRKTDNAMLTNMPINSFTLELNFTIEQNSLHIYGK